MSGKLTNYARKAILDHTWGSITWATMPTLYVTVTVQSSSGYAVGTEAAYQARTALPNSLASWPAAANGSKALGVEILLETAVTNLGTAHDIVFYDTPTPNTGNAIAYATLPTTRVVQSGDALLIPAGTIEFTFTASELFSTYLKNAWLDHIFGSITFMPPTNWYVGYTTDTPTDGVGGTEPAVGGYARADIPNNTNYFPQIALGSVKTNAQQVEWNEATASQGTVTHLVWYAGSNYAAKHPINSALIDTFTKPILPTNSLAFNVV